MQGQQARPRMGTDSEEPQPTSARARQRAPVSISRNEAVVRLGSARRRSAAGRQPVIAITTDRIRIERRLENQKQEDRDRNRGNGCDKAAFG